MVRTNSVLKHEEAVLDLIFCFHCDNPMVMEGDYFVCPNNGTESPESCTLPRTDAETLIRTIMSGLLERVLSDRVLSRLTNTIERALTAELDELLPHPALILDTFRIYQVQRDRLRESIQDRTPTREEQLELAELDSRIEEYQAEVQAATAIRDEYHWLRFVSNPKDTARDPKTYLDYADPTDTRQLIEMFVEKIRVGSESFWMDYRVPLPDRDNLATISSEELAI